MTIPPIVILGATTGPRVDAFRAAVARLGGQATFVGYDHLADDERTLEAALQPGTVLRFDSPDRERASLLALYRAGTADAAEAQYPVLADADLERVLDRRGAIGSPAQLAFGLHHLLGRARDLAHQRGARVLAAPDDIATTFDKAACANALDAVGVPVARRLAGVASFDDLIEQMRAARLSRVFVKLRYGSSAAGMMALALGPHGQLVAYTTAISGDDGQLYATRAVRRLTHHAAVRDLVDQLVPYGLQVEAWLPKASVAGKPSDLRVISVAGEPVFCIIRSSEHPMTNLHLGGERHAPDVLRQRVGDVVWRQLIATCKRVADTFPRCFMLGIDATIRVGDQRHAVLEVNAFGDHVKGVSYRGFGPQEWQILKYGAVAA
jgi:hypothetical protein